LEILDLVIPSLALGQAIGRWGNFINQEAYGGPTDLPWGIIVDGQKVHPTFLYESIIDFCIFLFLIWFSKHKKASHGQLLGLYLILYSAGRFFIEGLRTDSLMFAGMRVAQLVSLSSIVIGAGLLIYLKNKKQSS
jgi:phosphatidylglycerol:prolipoprotein diacylglycerol transferase